MSRGGLGPGERDLVDLGDYELTIGDKYREDVLSFLLKGKVIKRDY